MQKVTDMIVSEPEKQTVIKVENLCCKSGNRYLIHNINWEVKQGDHWILFGLNGSGKTTLLSIIAGFHAKTSGSVAVFGEGYTNENILKHRSKIGWVSSSFFDKYLSWESALNIVLSGKFGTLSVDFDVTDEDVVLAKKILTELRLGEKINQPFCLMSKGERQCVLIARALIAKPEILILDEPGTGLDVFAREYVMRTIDALAVNTDLTIIYVTHYPEEMLPSFDQSMLLREGRIFAKGKTEEVFTTDIISDFMRYPIDVAYHEDKNNYTMTLEVESYMDDLVFE